MSALSQATAKPAANQNELSLVHNAKTLTSLARSSRLLLVSGCRLLAACLVLRLATLGFLGLLLRCLRLLGLLLWQLPALGLTSLASGGGSLLAVGRSRLLETLLGWRLISGCASLICMPGIKASQLIVLVSVYGMQAVNACAAASGCQGLA